MVELRVEAKHAHDIVLEAFAQLRTLPADAKGDRFGFDPDAIEILGHVFGKDPIVRMVGVTNIKHARIAPAGIGMSQTHRGFDRMSCTRFRCSGVTLDTTFIAFFWVLTGSRYSMIRSLLSPSAISCGLCSVSLTAACR